MQLHNIARKTKNRSKKIVGRGGKRGTYSGRGIKGQNARAGHKKRPELRDIIKKLPKLRGRGKSAHTSIQDRPMVVNLSAIDKAFNAGEKVTPGAIVAKGLARGGAVDSFGIKVLGGGELTKKLTFSGLEISHQAVEKITKAGGSISA